MSKMVSVRYRGKVFWAFDVVSAVFLKHLIDVAVPRLGHSGDEWLLHAIENWRADAVVPDYGVSLDDGWSTEQVRTLSELIAAACDLLSKRDKIPAEEIASWSIVDDLRIDTRRLPSVDTAPVIRLGRAIVELVNGTLPEPPPGTWWYFGTEDAPRTTPKRS